MGPVSAEIEVDAPRERAFEAIADLSRRPSFTDHFQSRFHLTRIEPTGVGAGARFRTGTRRRSIWTDTVIDEVDAPHRVIERGQGGRANRVPCTTVWELLEGRGGLTRIHVSHWTEPSGHLDRRLERLSGFEREQERGWREALRRLRDLLEEDRPVPRGVVLAGGNRHATGIP